MRFLPEDHFDLKQLCVLEKSKISTNAVGYLKAVILNGIMKYYWS